MVPRDGIEPPTQGFSITNPPDIHRDGRVNLRVRQGSSRFQISPAPGPQRAHGGKASESAVERATVPKNERRRTTWLGGYIHYDRAGRPSYIIRKRLGDGTRPKISTRCHTETAALKELARFEADPANYVPGSGGVSAKALYLNKDLSQAFLLWSANECNNTPEWVTKQRGYLAWWADALRGVDLRKATLSGDFLPALDGRPNEKPPRPPATARQHRIAVLKTFYRWLREERDTITTAEDPTLGKLKVPQARPEQWKREKAIPTTDFRKVRARLASPWREAVIILNGTGWHVTELGRFARGGAIEKAPRGSAGVLLMPRKKSGEPHRTAVERDVLDAAKKLLAHGAFSRKWLYTAIQEACAAAGVKPFAPGSFRHTVATNAVNAGESVQEVSAFLGHRSAQTTKKFYATHATPKRVKTLS